MNVQSGYLLKQNNSALYSATLKQEIDVLISDQH